MEQGTRLATTHGKVLGLLLCPGRKAEIKGKSCILSYDFSSGKGRSKIEGKVYLQLSEAGNKGLGELP
jgi:hypothetical protein